MLTKDFKQTGTFQALYAAQNWLDANGYSFGPTCREMPIGILKGDWTIAKWKNLTKKKISELDGQIQGDKRDGPITVTLRQVLGA